MRVPTYSRARPSARLNDTYLHGIRMMQRYNTIYVQWLYKVEVDGFIIVSFFFVHRF